MASGLGSVDIAVPDSYTSLWRAVASVRAEPEPVCAQMASTFRRLPTISG